MSSLVRNITRLLARDYIELTTESGNGLLLEGMVRLWVKPASVPGMPVCLMMNETRIVCQGSISETQLTLLSDWRFIALGLVCLLFMLLMGMVMGCCAYRVRNQSKDREELDEMIANQDLGVDVI